MFFFFIPPLLSLFPRSVGLNCLVFEVPPLFDLLSAADSIYSCWLREREDKQGHPRIRVKRTVIDEMVGVSKDVLLLGSGCNEQKKQDGLG